MSSTLILTVIALYFVILISISYFTSRGAKNATFYSGDRNSKWYLVAYGMIGASLSGVTFISVPGEVDSLGFSYMQMVIGYLIGYVIIAFVLMPLYYRLNVTSIYAYLGERFGNTAHKTGAAFFIISRILGASIRLFLVADILQYFVFKEMGVSFYVTVFITLVLIYLYTYRGGIKTIVWTDTLQTTFMLAALGISIYLISQQFGAEQSWQHLEGIGAMDWFVTDDGNAKNYWLKYVLAGMFITLGMTGLDQDMMQKNLTCKNIKEAQKNMMSFSVILFFSNLLFLVLGGMLFLYIQESPELLDVFNGMEADKRNDRLFPLIALKGELGTGLGITFLLGLIAAAYSSADSALTSLTTSVSLDLFKIDRLEENKSQRYRKIIQLCITLLIFVTICLANIYKEQNVLRTLFVMASYTYGPLLGLFFFGIISKRKVNPLALLMICISIPTALILIMNNSKEFFGDFLIGSELLGINGLLCYSALYLASLFSKQD